MGVAAQCWGRARGCPGAQGKLRQGVGDQACLCEMLALGSGNLIYGALLSPTAAEQ